MSEDERTMTDRSEREAEEGLNALITGEPSCTCFWHEFGDDPRCPKHYGSAD
jgi:hypothetical protein